MGRMRLVWAELPGDTLHLGIKGHKTLSIFQSLSVLLKIVSSSGFVTNEGWIVLSRVDAWMSRSRQTSVGRIKSISFQFWISQSSWRVINICHLQQVLGASVLLHLNGLSAPLLCSGVLWILGIWWHLEIPTLENKLTYVIFILPV